MCDLKRNKRRAKSSLCGRLWESQAMRADFLMSWQLQGGWQPYWAYSFSEKLTSHSYFPKKKKFALCISVKNKKGVLAKTEVLKETESITTG